MLREINSNLYFLYKDTWNVLLTFWLIFIGFVSAFLLLTLSFEGVSLHVSTMAPATIFTIILGSLFVKDTFPFVVKLGSSRKGFVIAVVIYSFIFALIMTTIDFILTTVFSSLANTLNITEVFIVASIDPFFVEQFGSLTVAIYSFFLYLIFFAGSILVSSILFRFGFIGGGLVGALVFISIMVEMIREKFADLVTYFVILHDNFSMVNMIIPALILFILFWLIMNKASAIGKVGRNH